MNLRILKKLSKRAAPLLILLGDTRKQYRSRFGESHDLPFIGERKHWERLHCRPGYLPRNDWATPRGQEIVYTTRKGETMLMRPPYGARKGTIFVGERSGGEEPEWSEEPAYSALAALVLEHFVSDESMSAWGGWTGDEDLPAFTFTRPVKTPSDVFDAAYEILHELRCQRRAAGLAFCDAVKAAMGGAV